MRTFRVWVVLICLGAAAAAGDASAQTAPDAAVDRARLEQRLASVEILIEKSTAARQIEKSGDAAARVKHAKAREIHRQARAAFQAGQYARASELLPEASIQMFEAVRLSAPEEVTAPKARSDYQARLDSVNALYSAYQRVAAEKPGTAGAAETGRDIEKTIREAQRLAGEGRLDEGRAALDRAYLIVKAALSSLRSGDTLVRSLHFASHEEEYRYEVDRNDTHQMLIKVLLAGRPHTPGQQTLVDSARRLRARADTAAAGADHAAAVKLLEDSTRELIRAIRSAGVFIPS
jgi:hypothetical protein